MARHCGATPASAASVVFSGEAQAPLIFEDDEGGAVRVSVAGLRKHLFVGGRKFAVLSGGGLIDLNKEVDPESGSQILNVHLAADASQNRPAGQLRATFTAGSSPDNAWNIEQLWSDLQLSLGNGGVLTSHRVLSTADVPWILGIRFAGDRTVDQLHEHPEEVLELPAVRRIPFPELRSLDLSLRSDVVSQGKLSAPQLQAVCYAAHAFSQSRVAPNGVRGGFLLGDGTGCGKGRVIAALLEHLSLVGSATHRARRCLWVSTSRDLLKDAARDLSDLGADKAGLSLGELNNGTVSSEVNVLFATYARLRQAGATDHITDWLGGPSADGLLVFDEAHRAKNSGTQQGKMVEQLQCCCPGAAVLYVSATASTDVSQMAYMHRLGLWGPGRPNADFDSFRRCVEADGIKGMEAVALELKALGRATCRSLSHSKTHLKVRRAEPDSSRIAIYDRASRFFEQLEAKAEEAIAEGASGKSSSSFQQALWACQLRFFRQLLVSLKVPEVRRGAEEALMAGGQVVVALWGTGEAQLASASADGFQDEDTVGPSCPEIMLCQFLSRRFPCPPEGHVRTLMLQDSDVRTLCCEKSVNLLTEKSYEAHSLDARIVGALRGKACRAWGLTSEAPLTLVSLRQDGGWWAMDCIGATRAEELRHDLMQTVRNLGLPLHPLDELLDALGGPTRVAELSGRNHRLVRLPGGGWQVEARQCGDGPACGVNLREQEAFQGGEKHVAIITEAASTGISLHSDQRRLAVGFLPRPRTMILAELGWSAEQTLQQLGRVHRSNQRHPPRFELVLAPVAGEARVASALARRLRTLGAVTRGDQVHADGAGGGFMQALDALDLQRPHAQQALKALAFDVKFGTSEEQSAFHRLDLVASIAAEDESSGGVSKFLSRLTVLPIGIQQQLLERFESCLRDMEDAAVPHSGTSSALNAESGLPRSQLSNHQKRPARQISNPDPPPVGTIKRRRPVAAVDAITPEKTVAAARSAGVCMARVWAGGRGGSCSLKAMSGLDFCSRHAKEAVTGGGVPAHGRIDGPIPEPKRDAFRRAGLLSNSALLLDTPELAAKAVVPALSQLTALVSAAPEHDMRLPIAPLVATVSVAGSPGCLGLATPTCSTQDMVSVPQATECGEAVAAISASLDEATHKIRTEATSSTTVCAPESPRIVKACFGTDGPAHSVSLCWVSASPPLRSTPFALDDTPARGVSVKRRKSSSASCPCCPTSAGVAANLPLAAGTFAMQSPKVFVTDDRSKMPRGGLLKRPSPRSAALKVRNNVAKALSHLDVTPVRRKKHQVVIRGDPSHEDKISACEDELYVEEAQQEEDEAKAREEQDEVEHGELQVQHQELWNKKPAGQEEKEILEHRKERARSEYLEEQEQEDKGEQPCVEVSICDFIDPYEGELGRAGVEVEEL